VAGGLTLSHGADPAFIIKAAFHTRRCTFSDPQSAAQQPLAAWRAPLHVRGERHRDKREHDERARPAAHAAQPPARRGERCDGVLRHVGAAAAALASWRRSMACRSKGAPWRVVAVCGVAVRIAAMREHRPGGPERVDHDVRLAQLEEHREPRRRRRLEGSS